MVKKFKEFSAIPGFSLTLGISLMYLCLLVFLPLAALTIKASEIGIDGFIQEVLDARVLTSFKLTFGCSLLAAIINTIFGTIVAWFLVRIRIPLLIKKFLDSIIDLPLALPTAVSGMALTTLYTESGWIGKFLKDTFNMKVAFTPLGIVVAMIFIGIPFVVRTVGPVLSSIEDELEEAALSLGANRWQIFIKIIAPTIFPSVITGFTLAFARALGEYGTVIFIAGNMPMKTEIAALLIYTKLEQFNFVSATAIAMTMLLFSFILLLIINLFQSWVSKRAMGTQGDS
ncbi:MAG: sulfate ABC transporter permease subunit CysT [Oligoflexia bacterium]|nr:sulfate ABC transporter permease subunit CysT [Oligoflexia bacterium]